MSLSGPVLAAIDLSQASDEALRQAADLAHALGSRLRVCHVLPDLSQTRVLFPHLAGTEDTSLVRIDAAAEAAVRGHVEAVLDRPVRADGVLIERGSPHAGIRAAAERIGAGVIALGPGGTAARVAHHAPWAVLVARPAPAGGDVLAATDFSDPALPAIEAAVWEARRRGARLRLLHSLEVDVGLSAAAAGAPVFTIQADALKALTVSSREDLESALRRFETEGEVIVARGPAAPRITEAASSPPAALVVMGTHGRTGLRRLLLGSVADSVIRHAPCSVLAVPLREPVEEPAVA